MRTRRVDRPAHISPRLRPAQQDHGPVGEFLECLTFYPSTISLVPSPSSVPLSTALWAPC